MPWTTKDVDRFKKGLSDKQKRQWVAVANSVLQRCIDDGGTEEKCAGKAVRQANGVVKKEARESTLDFPYNQDKFQKQIDEVWNKWFPDTDDEIEDEVENEETEPVVEDGEQTMDKTFTAEEMELGEAKWDTAFVNNLPDSAFALILPGGKKDDEGKTAPRSLRKLPYKYSEGNVDVPHLRNALARLPQMKGVTDAQKSKALNLLKKVAAKHLKSYKGDKKEEAESVAEMLADAVLLELDWEVSDFDSMVRMAFEDLFPRVPGIERNMYVQKTYYEYPGYGTSVIVRDYRENKLYQLSYSIMDGEVEFGDDWTEVEMVYKPKTETTEEAQTENEDDKVDMAETDPVTIKLSEYGGGGYTPNDITSVQLVEGQTVDGNPRDPIKVKVKLIKPGFGNSRDKHYYPAEVLKRDAAKFVGAEMCITDHRENERSEDKKVSQIDSILGIDDDGSPIGEVTIYDPNFAEKTRNRIKAGKLHTLACSIKGEGLAKPGTVNGKKANVVTEISHIDYVDWVTKAGAGGQAVGLGENQDESQEEDIIEVNDGEPEDATLGETDSETVSTVEDETVDDNTEQTVEEQEDKVMEEKLVKELIEKTKLPQIAKDRLLKGEYADEAALHEAINEETEYVKVLTKSGAVSDLGETTSIDESKKMTLKEYNKRANEICGVLEVQ